MADIESNEMPLVALDGGPLADAVLSIVEASTIKDTIRTSVRDGMVGGTVVTVESTAEYGRLSSGERMLWQLLYSLAGRGEVNLHKFAVYYHGKSPVALLAASAVESALWRGR